MTNTQLAELLLVRLYDLAESGGHMTLHELNPIAKELGVTDSMKVFNIAKSLEQRGLIKGAFGRNVSACFTGNGSMFVEQGGDTGIIEEFRHSPARFIVDQSTHFYGPVSGSNVAAHSTVGSQGVADSNVERLLKAIVDRLAADSSLDETRRSELRQDIEALRSELQRSSPRRGMLRELLSTLSDVSSIAQLATQLQAALGPLTG
jgi:hypothetical protein